MKRQVGDLALLGGKPAFAQPLLVGRPTVGDTSRFLERIAWVLETGRFTGNGPLVVAFENRLAAVTGARHCVAVSNATTGLQLTLGVMGLTGEVIVPSMTYVATPHAVQAAGMRTVFCDIDPATGCLDPSALEAAITPSTSAIVGVHLWGNPGGADELEELARRHGLRLVFDAAQALGSRRDGRPVGSFGDAEVLSFHATKVVNSFEGGAIFTDDDELAHQLRCVRNFGFGPRGISERIGTNAKMTEAAAAMGMTSLEALEATMRVNREHLARYGSALLGLDGVQVFRFPDEPELNCHYAVVMIDPAVTGIHRDLVLGVLLAENVIARPYFSPACHQVEPYASWAAPPLPHTERFADQVLSLPTGPAVTPRQVDAVADLVRFTVTRGPEVTRAAAAGVPVPH